MSLATDREAKRRAGCHAPGRARRSHGIITRTIETRRPMNGARTESQATAIHASHRVPASHDIADVATVPSDRSRGAQGAARRPARRTMDSAGRSQDRARRAQDGVRRAQDSIQRAQDSIQRSQVAVRRSQDSVRRPQGSVWRSQGSVWRSRDTTRRSAPAHVHTQGASPATRAAVSRTKNAIPAMRGSGAAINGQAGVTKRGNRRSNSSMRATSDPDARSDRAS